MDFSHLKHYLFIALLAVMTIIFLYIISPFAYPILWAAIIAGLFYPLYKKINVKLKQPNLSTVIILALVFLIIVIPLIAISSLVISESLHLYLSLSNSGQINGSLQSTLEWFKSNPYTAGLNIDQNFWVEKFTEFANLITSFLVKSATSLTQNSITFLVMFLIMFYTLFFFVRDGEKFLKMLMHLCPLGDKYEAILYNRFISTARATLKGSLIVGLIQGALGGLMFKVAGIEGAVIWGILMVLFSVIPGFGSYFVWLPAAIIMLILGEFWTAVGMMLFGALVIGTLDNFLRPILVGRDTQMHPLLVLFSTLGGIVVFGISGFVVGPIITALLLAFWEMYENYYRNELEHNQG